jgi:hypothetical protein
MHRLVLPLCASFLALACDAPEEATASLQQAGGVSANLSVVIGDNPDPVAPGGSVTYSYTINNAGPSAISGYTVVIEAPPLTNRVESFAGYNCSINVDTYTCTRTVNHAVGFAAVITIGGNVPMSEAQLLSTAMVTVNAGAGDMDPDPSNDFDSETTTVAVNDPPVNTVPGTQMVPEDGTLTLSTGTGNAVSVADPDAGGGNMQVALSSTNGTLTLATTAGLAFSSGDGTSDANMQFTGTLSAVNAAMNGMTYKPTANFSGSATITITTNDQGNTGTGGIKQDQDSFTVNVTGVNDGPVNTVPLTTQTTGENQPKFFSTGGSNPISVADSDAGSSPVKITLTVVNGTVTLASTAGLTFQGGDGTADPMVQFTGTLTAVNAAMNGLRYDPPPGFTGNALLTILSDDQGATGAGGALTDSDQVIITVTAVNDPPVNTVPGAQTIVEDATLVFSAAASTLVAVNDPDAGGAEMRIVLSAVNGTLTLSGTAGLSFIAGDGTADSGMTFTGTIASVNAALAGMSFQPTANFSGSASVTISSNDQGASGSGGALQDTDVVNITVTAQNDAPVNAVPGTQSLAPGGTLQFNGANGNTISISDSDAGSAPMLVTLSVSSGTLTLGSQSNLFFLQGDGSADATMQFTGTITAVNNAMVNMAFSPAAGFEGQVTLTITTSDQGATGPGGAKTDTDMVTIVVEQNDPPVHTVPAAPTVAEDGTLVFTGANAIAVADPDVGSSPLLVSISAQSGVFSLSTTAGLVFGVGDGSADASMSFTGQLAAVNAALANAQFAPGADYSGPASVTITTSDQGATGAGGPKQDVDTINITVSAVDDLPAAANDATSVAEDGEVTVNVLANDTGLGDGGASVSVTTPPTHGAATVVGTSVKYTPAANYAGADAFVYRVTDGDGDMATATVSVTVTAVNDDPMAVSDAASTTIGVAVDVLVLANDADVDGDTLTVTGAGAAGNGTTAVQGGTTVRYTPNPGFTGQDMFTYTISDGKGGSAGATVLVSIGVDSDMDGLLDTQEAMLGTLPNDPDSDDDGVLDGIEVNVITTNPLDDDSDDDGLLDGNEDGDKDGTVDAGETDPLAADSDGDGLQDGTEKGLAAAEGGDTGAGFQPDTDPTSTTDPGDDDSDDDGLLDGNEDADHDGAVGASETDAGEADSDGDGLQDGTETGLTTGQGGDTGPGFVPDADPATTTDPLDPDSDGGGVSDGVEDADHDGQIDTGETDPNDPADDMPASGDADGDGVPDAQDNCPGDANASQLDTDGDGTGDVCDSTPGGDGGGGDGGGCGCRAGGAPGASRGAGILSLLGLLGLALQICRPPRRFRR